MRRMSGGAGGAGGQIFNIGKSKATLFDKTKVNVSFKDVAGLEGAKEEVEEIEVPEIVEKPIQTCQNCGFKTDNPGCFQDHMNMRKDCSMCSEVFCGRKLKSRPRPQNGLGG